VVEWSGRAHACIQHKKPVCMPAGSQGKMLLSRERARFGSDIDGDANLILRSACSHYAGVKRGRRRKTRASPLPGRPPGQRRRPVHACARSYVPERNETGGRSQSMQHHTAYVRGWPGEQSSSLHTHVHVVVSLELAAGDSITRTCSLLQTSSARRLPARYATSQYTIDGSNKRFQVAAEQGVGARPAPALWCHRILRSPAGPDSFPLCIERTNGAAL
jgi:hypothetical protein